MKQDPDKSPAPARPAEPSLGPQKWRPPLADRTRAVLGCLGPGRQALGQLQGSDTLPKGHRGKDRAPGPGPAPAPSTTAQGRRHLQTRQEQFPQLTRASPPRNWGSALPVLPSATVLAASTTPSLSCCPLFSRPQELQFRDSFLTTSTVDLLTGRHLPPLSCVGSQTSPAPSCRDAPLPGSAQSHLLEPASQKEAWKGAQGHCEAAARHLLRALELREILLYQSLWKKPTRGPTAVHGSLTHSQRTFQKQAKQRREKGGRPQASEAGFEGDTSRRA